MPWTKMKYLKSRYRGSQHRHTPKKVQCLSWYYYLDGEQTWKSTITQYGHQSEVLCTSVCEKESKGKWRNVFISVSGRDLQAFYIYLVVLIRERFRTVLFCSLSVVFSLLYYPFHSSSADCLQDTSHRQSAYGSDMHHLQWLRELCWFIAKYWAV